ncbi:MAG: NAD-dependent epimerase/dehydratase family protein [Candidatus Omnitrophota bacterium]
MKHILITGGCGFIGSNLAVSLIGQGYAVTVLDNLSRHGSDILLKKVLSYGATFIQGDVRNPGDLKALNEDYAAIIIASAEPSALAGARGEEAKYLLDVNLQGSIHCFEWARQRRVPVIFLSSSRVYPHDRLNACRFQENATRFDYLDGCSGVGRGGVSVEMPLSGVRSLYGATKLSAELILQEYAFQYELPAIINRCGVVSGPWQLGKAEQGVFAFWLASHYFKRPLNYIGFGGEGKQVRDILHIDDLSALVGRQLVALAEKRPFCKGEVFNVGGSGTSSLSLAEATAICTRLTGNRIPIGRIAENRPADMIWYMTDNGPTEDVFAWKPLKSAECILEDIYLWVRDHEPECRKIFC